MNVLNWPFLTNCSSKCEIDACLGWLRLRARASVMVSEGRCSDSPGLHVEVYLGKIPQTAPDVLASTLYGACVNY